MIRKIALILAALLTLGAPTAVVASTANAVTTTETVSAGLPPGVDRPTFLLSPHQDDELIRLGGYMTRVTDRGDEMHLVQVTDGAATQVKNTLGISAATTERWRNIEQRNAWQWTTDGRGQITYLREPDGAANADRIYTQVKAMMDAAGPYSELYVATWHYDRPESVREDQHVDHIASVDAARRIAADGYVVRYAVHPRVGDIAGSSIKYQASGEQLYRIEGAVKSYGVIGYRSTPANLDRARDGLTRVTS